MPSSASCAQHNTLVDKGTIEVAPPGGIPAQPKTGRFDAAATMNYPCSEAKSPRTQCKVAMTMKRLLSLLLLILLAWGTVDVAPAAAQPFTYEEIPSQRESREEFRQTMIWILAAVIGLGLFCGAWKLAYDFSRSRTDPKPKKPWDLP
jgi:hypothetical protein